MGKSKSRLVEIDKVWDRASHNAFTDLVASEAPGFSPSAKASRTCAATGRSACSPRRRRPLESAALIAEDGIDLRDPIFPLTA
jgi:hypothetical protein